MISYFVHLSHNMSCIFGFIAVYWSKKCIELLVSSRIAKVDTYYKPLSVDRQLWGSVADELTSEGYIHSPLGCLQKWRSIWSRYKAAFEDVEMGFLGPSLKMEHYQELESFHIKSLKKAQKIEEEKQALAHKQCPMKKKEQEQRDVSEAETRESKKRKLIELEVEELANSNLNKYPLRTIQVQSPMTEEEIQALREKESERIAKSNALSLEYARKMYEFNRREEAKLKMEQEKQRKAEETLTFANAAGLLPILPNSVQVALPIQFLSPTEIMANGVPVILPHSAYSLPSTAQFSTLALDIGQGQGEQPSSGSNNITLLTSNPNRSTGSIGHDHTYDLPDCSGPKVSNVQVQTEAANINPVTYYIVAYQNIPPSPPKEVSGVGRSRKAVSAAVKILNAKK